MSLAIDPSLIPLQEESLASSLRRRNGLRGGWGLIFTMLAGAVSFGVLPLLVWPIRMRNLFAGEAARLIEVSNVVAARESALPYRLELLRAARRTAPRPTLWVIPILCAVTVIIAMAQLILVGVVKNLDDVTHMTYRAIESFRLDDMSSMARIFFLIWGDLLLAGYVIHGFHLAVHFDDVRIFLFRFNALLKTQGVQAIPLPQRKLVPNLFWLAAGVVMTACFGAWYALPMALVGWMQRRDAFQMHRQLRRALADRVDALSTATNAAETRCQTPRCQTLLRPDARFCPRCGSAASPLSAAGSVWA